MKLGNVLEEQHTADSNPGNSFTKSFEYDATPEHNKLLSFTVGTTTYDHAYDACGNLTTENTDRHHQWGFDDRLRLFKIEASGTATKWAHYTYDAGGQRIKKVVNKTGGIQEVTVYIDGIFEHSYTKNSGTIDSDKHYNTLHVMDGRSRIATVRVGTDVEDDKPAIQYFLEDHLGTACVLYDDYGFLINREEYYPFGETSFGAFAKKRYRYCGKEKDSESGLYYYGARYYAAWTCRFVSVDPLAHDYPYLTPYNYAGNKPIGDLDIDGMQGTGDPPTKKDPRVFDDGTNRKVGPRTLSDPDYEIHNLPTNPKDGQVATFGYSRGKGVAQVDYVFDAASGSWTGTETLRNGDRGATITAPGIQSGSASANLGEGGASSKADGKGTGAKGKASTHKATPAQSKEQLAPTGSPSAPAKPRDVPAGGMATPSSSDVKPSAPAAAAAEAPDKVWPTVGFVAAAVESAAEDAQKAEPKYKSSAPAESPAATAKANRFLGFVENLMKGIGLVVDLKDLVEAGQKIWEGLKTKGQLLMGEVANLIWTGLGMVLQLLNPIVDMLFAFGDWIASVTGLKDKAVKWINEHWHPKMLSP